MQNPLSPDLMTPAERLDEVAAILATGLLRLHARKAAGNPSEQRQVLLDFTGTGSGHGVENSQRRKWHG